MGYSTFKAWLEAHQDTFPALYEAVRRDDHWRRVRGNSAKPYIYYVSELLHRPELARDMEAAYHAWQKDIFPHLQEQAIQEDAVQQRPTITLDTLFYSDRTRYQPRPGDETIPDNLTVAEMKELMIALNVSNERILSLSRELEQAEGAIEDLKQRLDRVERARGGNQ